MTTVEFWYEFASTYSYLSVMRIEAAAQTAGIEIAWRPFLLGPIFKAQGWDTSPFNVYPAKGRYMVRDIERIATARGLVFRMPETFPANGLEAARIALVGEAAGWCPDFTRAVFAAQFSRGEDISRPELLTSILASLGLDPVQVIATSCSDANKQALRSQTEAAVKRGVFGAPSFTTADGELFWGDDRLEQALAWAKR